MQKCQNKDCGVCNNKYILGYWTKQQWQQLIDIIYWNHLIFFILCAGIGFLIKGWIGLILGLLFFQVWFWIGGGLAPYLPIDEPQPPEPCSAGIENCPICGNGYDHEFNLETERSRKWWERHF